MKIVIPGPRTLLRILVDTALLATLLAVMLTLFPNGQSYLEGATSTGLLVGALVFRLDAHTTRDLVTRKRLVVAALMLFWFGFVGIAGRDIVGGHYFGAITAVCASLICILPARWVVWSSPEEWLGAEWRKVLEA